MASKRVFDIKVGADGKARVTCSADPAMWEETLPSGWILRTGPGKDHSQQFINAMVMWVNTTSARTDDLLQWKIIPPPLVIAEMVEAVRAKNSIVVPEAETRLDALSKAYEALRIEYWAAADFEGARKVLVFDFGRATVNCKVCNKAAGSQYVAGTMTLDDGRETLEGSFCAACMAGQRVEFVPLCMDPIPMPSPLPKRSDYGQPSDMCWNCCDANKKTRSH